MQSDLCDRPHETDRIVDNQINKLIGIEWGHQRGSRLFAPSERHDLVG
jgi:hypothetical protein